MNRLIIITGSLAILAVVSWALMPKSDMLPESPDIADSNDASGGSVDLVDTQHKAEAATEEAKERPDETPHDLDSGYPGKVNTAFRAVSDATMARLLPVVENSQFKHGMPVGYIRHQILEIDTFLLGQRHKPSP